MRGRHDPDGRHRRHPLGQERPRRAARAGERAAGALRRDRRRRGSVDGRRGSRRMSRGGRRRGRPCEVGASLADAFGASERLCVLLDGLGPWIATALHAAGAFDDEAGARAACARTCSPRSTARCARRGVRARRSSSPSRRGRGCCRPTPASRAWLDLLGEATQRFAAARGARGAGRRRARARARRPAGVRRGERPRRPAPPRRPRRPARATPTTPSTSSRAARRRGCATRSGTRSTPRPRATPTTARRPARWRTSTAATPARSSSRTGPRRRCGCCPRRFRPRLAACVHPGFTESEAALRAHGDPRRARPARPRPRASPSIRRRYPRRPTSSSSATPPLRAARSIPPTRSARCAGPAATIVVDEAFMDLVPGEPGSLVRERLDDVIVVRSITKALAIPGLRAGYAVARRAARPTTAGRAPAVVGERARARRPRRDRPPPAGARRDRGAGRRRARRPRHAGCAAYAACAPGRARRTSASSRSPTDRRSSPHCARATSRSARRPRSPA